jgi:hypothetical protein
MVIKAITDNCNYDASYTLTPFLVSDFENFKLLIFVVHIVHSSVLVKLLKVLKMVIHGIHAQEYAILQTG